MTREEQRRGVGGVSEHEWGETDYDWYATRVCKRCGVVHKYDHGPNNGPSTYTLGFRTSLVDPGCIATAALTPRPRRVP